MEMLEDGRCRIYLTSKAGAGKSGATYETFPASAREWVEAGLATWDPQGENADPAWTPQEAVVEVENVQPVPADEPEPEVGSEEVPDG